MKTAIVITGHMRSFDRCLPTLHWHVFRRFPGADFFVSTVFDENSAKAELLRKQYPLARVEIEEVPSQPNCAAELREKGVYLPAEWVKGQFYTHEPYAVSVNPQAVLRQLWQLERGWRMVEKAGAEYETVIRCRPDLWFHSMSSRMLPPPRWAYVPAWGGFGGVNDRFAVLGSQIAPHYFTTYSKIPDLAARGCPIHPESLVAAAIEDGGGIVLPVDAYFSTMRTNGELRAPELTSGDLMTLLTMLLK